MPIRKWRNYLFRQRRKPLTGAVNVKCNSRSDGGYLTVTSCPSKGLQNGANHLQRHQLCAYFVNWTKQCIHFYSTRYQELLRIVPERQHYLLENIRQRLKACFTQANFFLTTITFVKNLELEVIATHKHSKVLKDENRTIQRGIFELQRDVLAQIEEYEELKSQFYAFIFILNLHDANFSSFTQLDPWQESYFTEIHNRTVESLLGHSSLPYMHMTRDKRIFFNNIDKYVNNKQYSEAFNLVVQTFDRATPCRTKTRLQQYHASMISCAKAVEYVTTIAVQCFISGAPEEAIQCAQYAVSLIFKFSETHQCVGEKAIEKCFEVSDILNSLNLLDVEWMILLESLRKVVQVYWCTNRKREALQLTLSLLRVRGGGVTWQEVFQDSRWKGVPQALLTASLCLFSSHTIQSALGWRNLAGKSALHLLELALLYSEASLSEEQYLPSYQASLQFYMYVSARLCQVCTLYGATFDVILLASRTLIILEVLAHRNICIPQVMCHRFGKIIPAALNCQRERQTSFHSPATLGNTSLRSVDVYNMNSLLLLAQPFELILTELVIALEEIDWLQATKSVQNCLKHWIAAKTKYAGYLRHSQTTSAVGHSENQGPISSCSLPRQRQRPVINVEYLRSIILPIAKNISSSLDNPTPDCHPQFIFPVDKYKHEGFGDQCSNVLNKRNKLYSEVISSALAIQLPPVVATLQTLLEQDNGEAITSNRCLLMCNQKLIMNISRPKVGDVPLLSLQDVNSLYSHSYRLATRELTLSYDLLEGSKGMVPKRMSREDIGKILFSLIAIIAPVQPLSPSLQTIQSLAEIIPMSCASNYSEVIPNTGKPGFEDDSSETTISYSIVQKKITKCWTAFSKSNVL